MYATYQNRRSYLVNDALAEWGAGDLRCGTKECRLVVEQAVLLPPMLEPADRLAPA
ncbi:hypothetical protein [Gemmatimonas sp.]|uniref:hypothetical protein n=1 Tax=Gemmatimonas sp. TaxID=1962908 RepID=UPI0031CC10EC|nr:hypothetical protein [Gemmatimonas sp.]